MYDGNGLCGVKCNNENYLYRKNAQGDITHILDSTGMVVAKYVYDAWGNHAIVDASGNDLASGVGVLNPFRYRSYYYDEETDLYYLQTRYYDPELGRFLSQDDVSYLAPDTVNGLNLYAYCSNNPVMATDPIGTTEWWEVLLICLGVIGGAIIGGAMGGAVGLIGGVIVGGMLGAATVSDINLLLLGDSNEEGVYYKITSEESIQIVNSYKIKTPWVQWGYSFYLNHINPETRDIIKGTSLGVQFEWMLHNIAYKGGSVIRLFGKLFGQDWLRKQIEQAKSVDVGPTIFSDSGHDIFGTLMKLAYILLFGPWIAGYDLHVNGGMGE